MDPRVIAPRPSGHCHRLAKLHAARQPKNQPYKQVRPLFERPSPCAAVVVRCPLTGRDTKTNPLVGVRIEGDGLLPWSAAWILPDGLVYHLVTLDTGNFQQLL